MNAFANVPSTGKRTSEHAFELISQIWKLVAIGNKLLEPGLAQGA